jgi:hypothetical protein
LRFLGQPVPASGKVPHRCRHEVSSNVKERREGVRIKHWVNGNALKMYDKFSALRAETLIRDPGDFKVYRAAEGDPDGPKDWRPLRKGIADLHRRAEVSQAANERYLGALAAVQDGTPLRELAEPLCCPAPLPVRRPGGLSGAAAVAAAAPVAPAATGPVVVAGEGAAAASPPAAEGVATASPPAAEGAATASPPAVEGAATAAAAPVVRPRRVRALNPLAPGDAALLEAVSRHEFLINGLRNRDLRRLLYGDQEAPAAEQRRQSAAITRQLRLLRGHGLIHKVPKTHRYVVSEAGRRAITALLAARNASTEELTRCAG